MKQILHLMQREFSGQRAFQHVAEVSQHHRIQSSPGFRAAAAYCCDVFHQAAVQAKVVSYPSDYEQRYWTQRMWEEWSCEAASLELLEPEWRRLADFNDDKMSLIQRSAATPPEGITAPIILLDNGDEESGYDGVDFNGALVFTGGDLNTVRRWAVEKRGAVGIVSDRMAEFPPIRHRYDIPDALLYTSFWWSGTEKQCFGFVLSPKGGDALRAVCKHQAEAHNADSSKPRYPLAKAKVTAKLYPGAIENVEAFIPGETTEEILLEAHLCHPQASANDNASGVGVLLETARVLRALIDCGALPKPKRGIRFLLIAEMTGTYAWLSQNEAKLPEIKAGLNLDMVGENQDLCKGPLVVEYPPQASGSFVGDLAAAILDAVAEEAQNLGGSGKYALFKHTTAPFSGGSDHYILSDPTVGIPAPMLIQWPDKFYHTSADTIDKVDPEMLYRVGCLTATYAWMTANLGGNELAWVLGESRARYLKEITGVLNQAAEKHAQLNETERLVTIQTVREKMHHLLAVRERQIENLGAFLNADEKEAHAATLARQKELLHELTKSLWHEHLAALGLSKPEKANASASDNPSAQRVPKRLFRGPFSNRGWFEQLPAEEQEEYQAFSKKHGRNLMGLTTVLLYWVDGKRNLAELNHLVTMETGRGDVAFCEAYLEWLTRLGLIEWVK